MKNKSVILGIFIILTVSILTGCGFYNYLDEDEFEDHFGALGYTILDEEEGLFDADSYLVATKEDVPFKIEYYEFDEEVEAKKAYEKYKDDIVKYITKSTKNKEVYGNFYKKTVAESEADYIVISRVKNSLIFIDAENAYKAEIDKLLEDIEY